MTDVHSRAQRSRNMAAIRAKNTKPEVRVRSILHSMGYRFSLHRRDLPGKPDIVLPKYQTVVFVHGCFWHCHNCRYGTVKPATRANFWRLKRGGNVARDKRNEAALISKGWKVMVVWECETRSSEDIASLLRRRGLPPRT
ncbi:MAG TPA: DNA mismatch endonuclease Vsr [Clostridia bacterium]|nr:DNA mismatch endonuclease Vsr [Clostridia bacterium]